MKRALAAIVALTLAAPVSALADGAVPAPPFARPYPGSDGWAAAGDAAIRGVTIGPIENGYHPGVGYGSPPFERTLAETAKDGGTWIALTPFGRVHDLAGRGIDPRFEAHR